MNGRDSDRLWADIVQLTDGHGRENVRSLRIVLFILLRGTGNDLFSKQVLRLVRSGRSVLPRWKAPIASVEGGKLLFCFAHRTESNMGNILPVAREAERRGLLGGIVSAGDFSTDLTEFASRVPIVTADLLVSLLGGRDRLRIVADVLGTYREVSRMLSKYDSGLALRFHRHIGTALESIIRSLQMARAFRILLGAWSPSFVVSTSDMWPLEYQLVYQASCRQIPSLVIQHGALIHYYWPFTAELLAVWGRESLEEILSYGAPADRLVVGGMPASDRTFNKVRTAERGIQTRPGHPVCLILSQTNGAYLEPEVFVSYRRFLAELIPATPFVRWKVKLHPSENGSFYDGLTPDVKGRLEFYPKSTLLDVALGDADIVTTLYSTAGLEAMIAGLPLIIPIVSPRMTIPGLLPQVNGATTVHTPEDFKKELLALISNPEYRVRKLKLQTDAVNACFANQGRASEAILDLIVERLKQRDPPGRCGGLPKPVSDVPA